MDDLPGHGGGRIGGIGGIGGIGRIRRSDDERESGVHVEPE